MSLPTIPEAESILSTHLREHADIVALNARVSGMVPSTHSRPWVRVTQLDANDDRRSGVEHLIDYLLQFDCFAGDTAMDQDLGSEEASDLAFAVRAVLKAAQGQILDGAVVSSVRFTSMLRAPDTTDEPARARWIVTASVVMHG